MTNSEELKSVLVWMLSAMEQNIKIQTKNGGRSGFWQMALVTVPFQMNGNVTSLKQYQSECLV